MGSMSELMIEQWQAKPVHVEVQFLCPHCGHPASAWLEVPGNDDYYVEDVSCLNPEEEHEWTVQLIKKNGVRTAFLEGHPDVDVSIHEMDMSDEEDWEIPPPEPGAYGHFQEAMLEWWDNVDALGEPDGGSSLNRMLFVTLYSIIEAYLSDAIIGFALDAVSVQRKLVTIKELGLQDKQLRLDTILDNPTIISDMLQTALKGLSFHQLILVNKISKRAFGKDILPIDAEVRKLVVSSVKKRHDCVHRNGFNKEGKKHTDITREYLRKIGDAVEKMAESLENSIQDTKSKNL